MKLPVFYLILLCILHLSLCSSEIYQEIKSVSFLTDVIWTVDDNSGYFVQVKKAGNNGIFTVESPLDPAKSSFSVNVSGHFSHIGHIVFCRYSPEVKRKTLRDALIFIEGYKIRFDPVRRQTHHDFYVGVYDCSEEKITIYAKNDVQQNIQSTLAYASVSSYHPGYYIWYGNDARYRLYPGPSAADSVFIRDSIYYERLYAADVSGSHKIKVAKDDYTSCNFFRIGEAAYSLDEIPQYLITLPYKANSNRSVVFFVFRKVIKMMVRLHSSVNSYAAAVSFSVADFHQHCQKICDISVEPLAHIYIESLDALYIFGANEVFVLKNARAVDSIPDLQRLPWEEFDPGLLHLKNNHTMYSPRLIDYNGDRKQMYLLTVQPNKAFWYKIGYTEHTIKNFDIDMRDEEQIKRDAYERELAERRKVFQKLSESHQRNIQILDEREKELAKASNTMLELCGSIPSLLSMSGLKCGNFKKVRASIDEFVASHDYDDVIMSETFLVDVKNQESIISQLSSELTNFSIPSLQQQVQESDDLHSLIHGALKSVDRYKIEVFELINKILSNFTLIEEDIRSKLNEFYRKMKIVRHHFVAADSSFALGGLMDLQDPAAKFHQDYAINGAFLKGLLMFLEMIETSRSFQSQFKVGYVVVDPFRNRPWPHFVSKVTGIVHDQDEEDVSPRFFSSSGVFFLAGDEVNVDEVLSTCDSVKFIIVESLKNLEQIRIPDSLRRIKRAADTTSAVSVCVIDTNVASDVAIRRLETIKLLCDKLGLPLFEFPASIKEFNPFFKSTISKSAIGVTRAQSETTKEHIKNRIYLKATELYEVQPENIVPCSNNVQESHTESVDISDEYSERRAHAMSVCHFANLGYQGIAGQESFFPGLNGQSLTTVDLRTFNVYKDSIKRTTHHERRFSTALMVNNVKPLEYFLDQAEEIIGEQDEAELGEILNQ